MALASTLIGASTAAAICQISPQLLRYRALTGKLPIVSRHPLKFKLSEVLKARQAMAVKSSRGRPRTLTKLEALACR